MLFSNYDTGLKSTIGSNEFSECIGESIVNFFILLDGERSSWHKASWSLMTQGRKSYILPQVNITTKILLKTCTFLFL